MDLTHGGWPRRLVWAGAVAGAAATLCLVALTGHSHGSTRRLSPAGASAGRAAQLVGGPAATAARLAAAGLAGHAAPAARHARPDLWLINPDAPLPRLSPWRPLLAVARRFAAAYLSYEVGELGSAVRRAIVGTSTPAFAAQLLSDRAGLPPGVRADQVRQRLVALAPVERVLGAAVTLVTVRSSDSARNPSAFELRLVRRLSRPPGWRVAAITVL
ncbi:MAG TPA: hypothetical protein VG275_12755 [Solirubrobacteraceae bacterium]|jgi:hypothetical protein|nr:hypothetical protein [Solirubrobacteraceae bacterium]